MITLWHAVLPSIEKPFNIGSVLHVLLTDIAFVFRNVIEFMRSTENAESLEEFVVL